MNLLYVEDSDDLVACFLATMKTVFPDINIVHVPDGIAAYFEFRDKTQLKPNEVYDMIVTDNSMPRMSGEALAGLLREEKANVPMLLFTSSPETVAPESLYNFNRVISKARLPILLDEIRYHLSIYRAGGIGHG
jgi:DNA-binding response OmpR family regulator